MAEVWVTLSNDGMWIVEFFTDESRCQLMKKWLPAVEASKVFEIEVEKVDVGSFLLVLLCIGLSVLRSCCMLSILCLPILPLALIFASFLPFKALVCSVCPQRCHMPDLEHFAVSFIFIPVALSPSKNVPDESLSS